MNIWVPYTKISPATLLAVQPYEPRFMPMEGDDAYPRFLAGRWRLKDTFINIEHDIDFHPGAPEEIWDCPEPWCAYSYGENFRECTTTLGLCKFSWEFQEDTAGVWEAMLDNALDRERNPNGLDIRGNPKWKLCDCWLTAWARHKCGIEVHQHWPAVRNVH